MSLIKLVDVSKIYSQDGTSSIGLQNINLEFSLGEFVAITGESGSGKSTLLNIASLLDTYEEGEIFINGKSTIDFTKEEYAKYQSDYVSFVFQEYNIIDSFSLLENVMLPLQARGYSFKEAKEKALKALEDVSLKEMAKKKAINLSGGEKQRVVIARALVSDTPILACDEPTGNLDSKTGKQIIDIFKEKAKDKLVLYVTHDYNSVKDIATRHIEIKDGHVVKDEKLKKSSVVEDNLKTISKQNKALIDTSVGIKEVIKTPKKSILSFLISLVLSIVSIGLVIGMDSSINNFNSALESSTSSIYVDGISTPNRVIAYDNPNSSVRLKDYAFDSNMTIDKGNVFSSSESISLSRDIKFLKNTYSLQNLGLVYDSLSYYKGNKPVGEKEVALVISPNVVQSTGSEEFETNITDLFSAKTYITNQSFSSLTTSDFTGGVTDFYFTGIIIDYDNYLVNNSYGVMFSPSSMATYMTCFNNIVSQTMTNLYVAPSYIYTSLTYYSNDRYIVDSPNIYAKYEDGLIHLSSIYKSQTFKVKYHDVNIIVDPQYIVYEDVTDYSLVVSLNAITKIFLDNGGASSIYTTSIDEAKKLTTKLNENKFYSSVASTPRYTYQVDMTLTAINLVLNLVLIIVGVFLLCLIGSLILGIIYATKKKDYAIFMTLSFSKGDIRAINLIEILSFFIISSLITYLVSIAICYPFTLQVTSGLAISLAYLYTELTSPLVALCFFAFNILFGLLISTLIMKRLNKKSRAANLRKENSLL